VRRILTGLISALANGPLLSSCSGLSGLSCSSVGKQYGVEKRWGYYVIIASDLDPGCANPQHPNHFELL